MCLYKGLVQKGSSYRSLATVLLCIACFMAVYYSNSYNGGKVLDDRNAGKLIAVGTAILVAGILADNVNLWLKQVASRPRYRYLITLDDPISKFRNWWHTLRTHDG